MWTRPARWVAAVVVACAWAVTAQATTLEEVKASGALHVAVYNDFAPFSDDGKGIDVDVGKALAEKLGVKAEVRGYHEADDVDGDLRNIVWRGHHLWRERLADVMLHVPVDPYIIKKNEQVLIFAPYFRERLVVARNRNRIPQLATLQVFTSERIGVQAETLEDRYLMTSFGGILREHVVHFSTLEKATAALLAGEVSAVMGRQTLIEAGLGTQAPNFEISAAPTPGIATTGWELGLAVKADNRELMAALSNAMAQLIREGAIERIFQQHGITYRAPVGASPVNASK